MALIFSWRETMPWIIRRSDELYHHGILGQKWGDRNGPPYPLDNSKRSSSEKRQNGKSYAQLEKDFPYSKLKENRKLENLLSAKKSNYVDEIEEFRKLEKESSNYRLEDHRFFSNAPEKIEDDKDYKKVYKEYKQYMEEYISNPPAGKTKEDLYEDSKFLDLSEKESTAYANADKRIGEEIWNKNGKRITYLREKVSENSAKQEKIVNTVLGKMLNDMGYENTEEGRNYISWIGLSIFYDN